MANNIAAGKWKQMRGELKKQWGKLTDDQFDVIEGDREKLIGKIQEVYGKDREVVEREVAEFFDRKAHRKSA
ncbi:MAG: CsbD family protein [Polyangiaceae bacterium]